MFSLFQRPTSTEDLATLQNELEDRLVNVISSKWKLEQELTALTNTSSQQPLPTLNSPGPSYNNAIHLHQKKKSPKAAKIERETNSRNKLKKQVVKNEAPDKLWPFVSQFCTVPNEEQMQTLRQMIDDLEKDEEYYSASLWQQQTDSPPKKKAKTESSLGALTQRLVSSLIEESEDETKGDNPTPSFNKKLKSVGDPKNLETKIRQKLEEYSILTQQDLIPYHDDDEHLRQLRALQHELLLIQTQNYHHMRILYKRAKKYIALEKEREKLRKASADIVNIYQRLVLAKQRKRKPSEKELDTAWKASKAHETIFKKCDDLYMSTRRFVGISKTIESEENTKEQSSKKSKIKEPIS